MDASDDHDATPASQSKETRLLSFFDPLLWANVAAAIWVFVNRARWLGYIGVLKQTGGMWLSSAVLFDLASGVGLALLHLIAAVGCLKRKPNARMLLLICSVLVLAMPFIHLVKDLLMAKTSPDISFMVFRLTVLRSVQFILLAIVTIAVLSRDAVAALFSQPAESDDPPFEPGNPKDEGGI